MNKRKEDKLGHAIVLGGSFAGMVTARALSRYFKKITIIERDSLTAIEQNKERKGVPQRFHAHTLWPIGYQALQKLFPNIEETLIKRGAYLANYPNDAHSFIGGWKPRINQVGKKSYVQSRVVLDEVIRSLVKECPTIDFRYDTEVKMLLSNFKEKKIQGVLIFDGKKNEEMSLYADLVVDASGYHTSCPDWLDALGYGRPEKEEVRPNVYVLSRYYRWPETLSNWKVARIYGECKAGVVASRIEDDDEGKRWIVTLSTESGEAFDFKDPEAEFERVMQGLPDSEIYTLMKQGKPLTPVFPFLFPANRRYHYETMKSKVDGFLAIGDAFFALNPRNGLGLNNIALTVELLDQAFKDDKDGDLDQIIHHFYQSASVFIDQIWPLTVNGSLKYPETLGKRPFGLNLWNWYMGSVIQLANKDPEVWLKLWSVTRLEKPIGILYYPSILFKVLLQSIANFKENAHEQDR